MGTNMKDATSRMTENNTIEGNWVQGRILLEQTSYIKPIFDFNDAFSLKKQFDEHTEFAVSI